MERISSSAALIISLSPFIAFLVLLLWKKSSLLIASLAAFIITLVFSIIYWQIIPIYILASLTKGIFISVDIFTIIFGAVLFLGILQKLEVIKNLSYYLESISKDYRVQVIILAWFFESFLEGTAGFGSPAAIVVPILVSLGLSPLNAVIIGLLGNSSAVTFGAAGTPIRVGFAGLNTVSVPVYAAALNCIGFFVPIFMLWALVHNQTDSKVQFKEALPFAIWSGLVFVFFSFLVYPLGQEFPSIVGSLLSFTVVLISIKLKLFIPRTTRPQNHPIIINHLPLHKIIAPYALLVLLLIIGKIFLGSINIQLFNRIPYVINLFNPGTIFIIVALTTLLFFGKFNREVIKDVKNSLVKTMEPFMVIALMSSVVQLMLNSGFNHSQSLSSLDILASSLKNPLFVFLTPFVGAFGSFITGSATLSNLMFGNILSTTSLALKVNPSIVLSLAVVGAAAGNMIALADILSAETVVGLHNQERHVVRGVFLPCLIYLFTAGIIGYILTRFI